MATSGIATPLSAFGGSIAPTAWQDDICLEPITPVPGFSKLCNACIKLFRDNTPTWQQNTYVLHIRYSEVLEKSARRGCRLCALLLEDIQDRANCLHFAMTSEIGLDYCKTSDQIGCQIWFRGVDPSWNFTLSMIPKKGQSVPTGSLVL